MAFKGFIKNKIANKESNATGKYIKRSKLVVFDKEPIPQVTKFFKLVASEKYSKALCIAPQICEIIKPISKRITLLFTFFEMANINSVTKKLPVIADTTINVLPINRSENK